MGKPAENHLYSDLNACLLKLGILSETAINYMFELDNIPMPDGNATFYDKTIALGKLLPPEIYTRLDLIQKKRNKAAHEFNDSIEDCKILLEMTYKICVWFMQTYGDENYKPVAFVLPKKGNADNNCTELEERVEKLKNEKANNFSKMLDTDINVAKRIERSNKAFSNFSESEKETRTLVSIVVDSEKEKEHGQILKNIIGKLGKYEAVLWTIKQYTDNEPTLLSSARVIFIGENEVSKRVLSTMDWKFKELNMKYGWCGPCALLTVDDVLLTKEQLNDFKQVCEQQENNLKNGNFATATWGSGAILSALASVIFPFAILIKTLILIASTIFVWFNISSKQMAEQKKIQYPYLIRHFVMNNIDSYIEGDK
jgi:hypothetical protein